VFHEPGMIWMNGRMSMAVQEGPELSLQLRLLRTKAIPWVTADFTENFDQLMTFSETHADDPDLHSMNFTAKFAEGGFCHGGFFGQQLFMPLFLSPPEAPSQQTSEACGTVISASVDYGNVSMCVGSDGVPRELNMSFNGVEVGAANVDQYRMTATFVNASLATLPQDAFALPAACAEGPPPAACSYPGDDAVETLTVTRWNGVGGLSCGLQNKMTSDFLGSLTIMAWTAFPAGYFLQVYNVSVHRGFAPMQDCNYNPDLKQQVCTGGDRTHANAKSVGRSSSNYMAGAFGGQCSANSVVGSWYGFPAEGECAPGWDIGFNGCTWKTEDFKVVANDCIANLCLATYEQEEAPYSLTQDCWERAIAECPDLKGEPGPTCFARADPDVHV